MTKPTRGGRSGRRRDKAKKSPGSAPHEEFRFRNHDTVGSYDAEEDLDVLSECFVDTGNLDLLRDLDDPRRIVVGRTGSGKTALLRMLERAEDRCIWLRPDDLALTHVSNSTIIRFLSELGVNLEPFYKLLWRHVLAVELLQKHFGREGQSPDGFFAKLKDFFKTGQKKNRAKVPEYLRDWGPTFWEDTEYRVREITTNLEREVTESIGLSVELAKAQRDAKKAFGEERRVEVVHKAQRVVDAAQAQALNTLIDALDELFADRQKPYFVLIDGLDENWVDDAVRYRLIMALLLACRDFRRVRHVKIVVALRRDLLERVFRVARTSGFQKEKYESLMLPIRWRRDDLLTVLDRRVQHLVAARFHSRPPTHRDLLPAQVEKVDISDYLNRLVRNPRDVIRLFNACIEQALDTPRVNLAAFQRAMGVYSRSRFDALADEWSADYPELATIAGRLLRRRPPSFKLSAIPEKLLEDVCLEQALHPEPSHDPIRLMCQQAADGTIELEVLKRTMVLTFYKIGLVGLKLRAHDKPSWIDVAGRTLSAAELNESTSVVVHPAFHRALGIRTAEA